MTFLAWTILLAPYLALLGMIWWDTDKASDKAVALWTGVLSIATIGLVASTLFNAAILEQTDKKIEEQVKIANGQLAAVRAEQRPWIKAEGIIDPSLPPVDMSRPGGIPFRTRLTNTGKSPAKPVTNRDF